MSSDRIAPPKFKIGKGIEGKESLPALTGVRFFAAAYVVIFHFRDILPEKLAAWAPAEVFFDKGYLGVSLFFLLSGFILAVVYQERLNTWDGRRLYVIARFARIYPVYLVGLLLMYGVTYAHNPAGFSWSQGIQVFLLVQAWHPLNHKIAGYWNPVAWSLSVEAFFYLCFLPLLPLLQRRRNRWLALLLSAALFVAIVCKSPDMQLFQLLHQGRVANSLPFAILRLPEFFAGMLLGLIFLRAGVAGALLVLFLPLHGWNSLIVLPASALIYGLATQRTVLSYALSSTVLHRLGQASYAIYLLQLGVTSIVARVLLRFAPGIYSSTSRVSFIVLILFSLLVYRFWEEPLRHQIRARLPGSSKR